MQMSLFKLGQLHQNLTHAPLVLQLIKQEKSKFDSLREKQWKFSKD